MPKFDTLVNCDRPDLQTPDARTLGIEVHQDDGGRNSSFHRLTIRLLDPADDIADGEVFDADIAEGVWKDEMDNAVLGLLVFQHCSGQD